MLDVGTVGKIAEGFPQDFRRSWFGTHFFNPPRYMRLLELIPAADSERSLMEAVAWFCDVRLGKGIVHAKDTPNFIGNRIGTFSVLNVMRLMQEIDLTIEDIDSLTGTPLGWPKSATFRTIDLVGLDILGHVVSNMTSNVRDERSELKLPDFYKHMLDLERVTVTAEDACIPTTVVQEHQRCIEPGDSHTALHQPLTDLSAMALAVSPRWNMTPCSSCKERTKSPICAPRIRSMGRCSGAITCTSMSRSRKAAATSSPMKLAPSTATRRALLVRSMMARQSASDRSVSTCGSSAPGIDKRTGSAPVASSSRSKEMTLPSASATCRERGSMLLTGVCKRRSIALSA